jgi:hypothetical protein
MPIREPALGWSLIDLEPSAVSALSIQRKAPRNLTLN